MGAIEIIIEYVSGNVGASQLMLGAGRVKRKGFELAALGVVLPLLMFMIGASSQLVKSPLWSSFAFGAVAQSLAAVLLYLIREILIGDLSIQLEIDVVELCSLQFAMVLRALTLSLSKKVPSLLCV